MKFKVTKNLITRLDSEMLTTKNVNSIECSFTFSDDYEGLELFAVFYRDSSVNRYVKLNDGKCIIPYEVLEDAGTLCVGAYGIKTETDTVEKRLTTNFVEIIIERSLSSSDSPGNPPISDLGGCTEDDMLEWLASESIIDPVSSSDGELYTDNQNNIYIL